MKCILESTHTGHYVKGRGTILTASMNMPQSLELRFCFVDNEPDGLEKLSDLEIQKKMKDEMIAKFDEALASHGLIGKRRVEIDI